ncbi:hypothetical protein HYH03_002719 [Edaphochlamys debaryana]|uniref:Uncharacterized protein n=1 Tax=Edaphochlamys debaryana TaxID=47281 RepID=A0A836C3I4_9CHLO|nr:hypothetical protein HYH03_002719 [Edaphochlamys debaryana]|eukprot:KAG2499136.1 hypothetical protein HYH03_002719 [Edaphochlamys debaryana]
MVFSAGAPAPPRLQACVTDIVETERALRRLEALHVVRLCRAALVHHTDATAAPCEALDGLDDPGAPGSGAYSAPLSPTAAAEVRFCTSWLAYLWGRAALAGIHPQVSQLQAEHWASRIGRPTTPRDFADIHAAFQELHLYGIEELLWKNR